ncbi:PAS domain-containing sensor histidine kinase [Cryptosporangium aurantiacum]|uniref:histidine kinase n=1 Tax=Cryptosporangium aurantiacum TaxID=134849 RepID=A0A1M7RB38_9ACTN|nr:PAS domain-containing protein [Cryptosporangium aurantiacum]SHN43473.1 PAS domain S-box-containing protein [Cryptosporangium aurantiacum]
MGELGQPADAAPMVPSAEAMRRLGANALRSPLGLALADAEGRIEWMNPAFSQATGVSPADAVGRHPLDLLLPRASFPPDEVERLRREVASGGRLDLEYDTETRDGRPYSVSLRMGPGTGSDTGEYFVILTEDITERRRSAEEAQRIAERAEAVAHELHTERELLASVLSTIPHVVFWKDTEHRYLGCNEPYARLRGLGSEKDLVGKREGELDQDELGLLIAQIEGHVLDSGTPVVDQTVTVTSPDGPAQVLLLSVLPRHAEASTPGGVIGVGADVTRITALERQLAQATRLESIGQLAAGLAHEINTPVQYVSDNVLFLADSFTDVLEALRSIANVARGAEQDPRGDAPAPSVDDLRARLSLLVDGLDLDFLGTEIPSALEQTLEGVGRVAEIVRAMKEFSHPGQGRTDTDLNRAVESTVQVSRNEWKYVAHMEMELDPAVGLVPCYEGELKQVVLNLIVNAAHAIAEQQARRGEQEQGRIGISTRRVGDSVQIAVSDTGTGMDEATRMRIFDPFFTTKEVGKGTGQGLAMAHSCVVGKHGGSIEVDSVVGEGTTFRLILPGTVDQPDPGPDPMAGW